MRQGWVSRPRPCIGFLPIGRLDNEGYRRDYDLGRQLIRRLDADIVESPLVWEQPAILDSLVALQHEDIDMLVIYALHGVSAEQSALAGARAGVPVALWALPTNFSISSTSCALGALRERGRRVKLVYAPAGDESALIPLSVYARAAYAIAELQRTRIATVGGFFPNPAAYYHRDTLADRLGPQIVGLPIAAVQTVLAGIPDEGPALDAEIARLRAAFQVDADDELLRKAIRFHWALRDIAGRQRLTAIVLECHTELTKLFGINPCFAFADADSPYVVGCESDAVMTVAMLTVRFLAGRDAYLGDVLTLQDDMLTLTHCGASCRIAAGGAVHIRQQFAPAHVGVPNRLAQCVPAFPAGPATLLRLHGPQLDQMHLAMGEVVAADVRERLTIQIRLDQPAQFLAELCANHYLLVAGDLRPELRVLCEWLGIALTET